MEEQHRICDFTRCVFPGRSPGRVVEMQIGQCLARMKSKIVDDDVAFRRQLRVVALSRFLSQTRNQSQEENSRQYGATHSTSCYQEPTLWGRQIRQRATPEQ